MKKPIEINFYPLDVKKDSDSKGLWFYVPEWIVRAYRIKNYGSNMGRVKFMIKEHDRAMFEYLGEEKGADEYYKRNWSTRLSRERKIQRKKELVVGV